MELFFIADFGQSHISYPRLIIRHPHNLERFLLILNRWGIPTGAIL